MYKVGIVIPFYNRWDLTHARILELYKKVPTDTNIFLVDDCSTDVDCRQGIAWWQSSVIGDRLHYFKNASNVGFGGSMNTGVKLAVRAGCDAVILLSNDVRVFSDIVSDTDTLLSLNKRILIGGEILRHDTGWNVLPGCGPVPYANGWFLATHKTTWKELGGFDPRYGRFDYEDVDLSTQAVMLHIPLISSSANVRHIGGQSVSKVTSDREGITRKNQKLWIEKWSPHAETLRKEIYG